MSKTAFHPFANRGMWDTQITTQTEPEIEWIWPGFIARGNMTLLTSLWKSGKTTLLLHLLSRRASGGQLLGQEVEPGKTIVISEEPRSLWAERCRQSNFGGTIHFIPQPFSHLPSEEEWRELMDHVFSTAMEHGVDLVIIDSLAHFLRGETSNTSVMNLLLPIRELTSDGLAAVLTHHPRRRGDGEGVAGRGHGTIHSEVDISIEMRRAGCNPDSRARRLFCLSRLAATPRRLVFELNADGLDYTVLPDTPDDEFSEHWDVLRMVLEDAQKKLTRTEILEDWPADFPKPASATLWRWLTKSVADGLIKTAGTGRKSDPFLYWLAANEERWQHDPVYQLGEQAEEARKRVLRDIEKAAFQWKTRGE